MFKIGQKVICVNDSNQEPGRLDVVLEKVSLGEIYVIRGHNSIGGVLLDDLFAGYHYDGEEIGFLENRFRSLQYELISMKSIIEKQVEEKSDIHIKEPIPCQLTNN